MPRASRRRVAGTVAAVAVIAAAAALGSTRTEVLTVDPTCSLGTAQHHCHVPVGARVPLKEEFGVSQTAPTGSG